MYICVDIYIFFIVCQLKNQFVFALLAETVYLKYVMPGHNDRASG